MKNSLLVNVGDTVITGQPIARVGSSGISSTAHLHFEVRDSSGLVIDPFSGDSQGGTSMWVSQPGYDTAQYIIDEGFTPYRHSMDMLKDRYLVTDSFYVGEDTTVAFWAFVHGRLKGEVARTEWFTPAGKLYRSYDILLKNEHWHSYVWPYIKMPGIKGEWTVRLRINDEILTSRHFYILNRRMAN